MSSIPSKSSIIVEIRAAEGGADARLICLEQLKIYERLAARGCL
jgi:protein subunit release factor A